MKSQGLYNNENKPKKAKRLLKSTGGLGAGPRVGPPDKTPFAWVSEGNVGAIDSNGKAIVVRNF